VRRKEPSRQPNYRGRRAPSTPERQRAAGEVAESDEGSPPPESAACGRVLLLMCTVRSADYFRVRPTPLVGAMIAVLVCLALPGCGSSGSGPLTAAQLASRGSSICVRAVSEEKALHVASVRSALPRLEEIGTREVADLSKLAPPASEQASYKALLGEASQLVGLLRPLQSALAGGETPPPELLAHARELAARLAALDGPLGMGACSSEALPS
jgi:hypothetical protein